MKNYERTPTCLFLSIFLFYSGWFWITHVVNLPRQLLYLSYGMMGIFLIFSTQLKHKLRPPQALKTALAISITVIANTTLNQIQYKHETLVYDYVSNQLNFRIFPKSIFSFVHIFNEERQIKVMRHTIYLMSWMDIYWVIHYFVEGRQN